MNKNENLKNLKNRFNLHDEEGIFATFEYDEELKRYQSDYGWLSLEKVFELSKGKDRAGRWIEWIE